MKWLVAALTFFVALHAVAANACNCPSKSVKEAFSQFRAVFVGEVVSVHQEPFKDGNGKIHRRYTIENAVFRVTKAWKGVTVGKLVHIRSTIGPGPCGMSCINSPVWLLEKDPHTKKGVPVKFSKRWLVYGYDDEPYELSYCSRSSPLDFVQRAELTELDQLASRPVQNKRVAPPSEKAK